MAWFKEGELVSVRGYKKPVKIVKVGSFSAEGISVARKGDPGLVFTENAKTRRIIVSKGSRNIDFLPARR